ncbi:longevity assurance proteins LAG1/LAC1 [Fomitopsis betulina]|nr:longevity assurance proteins LAG1/LAC1 [Fomitopsis betulina]
MAERKAKLKPRKPNLRLSDSFTKYEQVSVALSRQPAQHSRVPQDRGPPLVWPFQTSDIDSPVPSPSSLAGKINPWSTESRGLLDDLHTGRWIIAPRSSFTLLLIVVVAYCNWEFITPYISPGAPNPFAPLLFLSHYIPTSSPDDPRYAKGYLDLVFLAYYIIFWSWVRQFITIYICWPLARWFGIRKSGKLERFGEQGYAVLYFTFTGVWGIRIMSQLPIWWYRTEHFWLEYPHWDLKPELKRYYLMQAAYWCQQFIVLALRLEKPRKDYYELIAHHFVTLWLVGWSYLTNLTHIGVAVYISMDIPDTFLALSKIMNYIQWNRSKIFTFVVLFFTWSYFRLCLNWVILHSVWTEFDLMPETSKRWSPDDGVWLVWWMKYQIFLPILLLLFLNLFWYFLILRIAYRAITLDKLDDVRSDDEDDKDD